MRIYATLILVLISLSGCYTMLYPPPEEFYTELESDTASVTVVQGDDNQDITIINENQIAFDRYYHDYGYYRYGGWGSYGYWDPYYYNPYGYYRDYRWRSGRYHDHHSHGSYIPKQKKSRRKSNPRVSTGLLTKSTGSSSKQNARTQTKVVEKGTDSEVTTKVKSSESKSDTVIKQSKSKENRETGKKEQRTRNIRRAEPQKKVEPDKQQNNKIEKENKE